MPSDKAVLPLCDADYIYNREILLNKPTGDLLNEIINMAFDILVVLCILY